jgi:hypothetical protein
MGITLHYRRLDWRQMSLWLSATFFLTLPACVQSAEPPKPFTPVEATLGEFRCLGRVTALGNENLPSQITAAKQPLLAAPIRLFSDPDVIDTAKRNSPSVAKTVESASWQSSSESADVTITSKLTADCDGFSWYEIRLKPKRPLTLRSLGLEIPRTAKTARYLHSANFTWSNVSQGLPELGGTWSSPFVPYVWLGDEERGLAWCAESDEGWQLSDPANAVRIETQGNVVRCRFSMIDHEMRIEKPLVMRFGLQASPVKPVSFAWRSNARILHNIHYDSCRLAANGRCELDTLRDGGVKTVVIHDSWTKYFGQTVPSDAAQLRELINACHARRMRLLVYLGYGLARTAPDLVGHHDAWSVLPLIPWDPGYKPETRAFDATCGNSGWANWLVAGTDKLFSDFDLDGLYFDGTSEAWRCQNEAHGCGWRDSHGNLHATYPMLATRTMMRRIAETVHRHKPDAILDAHMSSNFTLPTLAYCDSVWNGEQFESHTSGERFEIPLHAFRTEFMGCAHGLDAEFLCYENRPFTFDEAIALAWVHGVEVRPYPQSLPKVTPIWRAMDRFDVSDARWHPYWSEPVASSQPDVVKVSAWTKDRKALLFVSHLERKPADVTVRIDPKKIGMASFKAKNALADAPLTVEDGTVKLLFSGMGYSVVELGQ